MSYGFWSHYDNFCDDISCHNLRNTLIVDGWVHPLVKTLPSLVNNSWWNIVLDDLNVDEKSLGKLTEIATL